MKIDNTFFKKCVDELAYAFAKLQKLEADSKTYDVYRVVTIERFEVVLGQVRKLFGKLLQAYLDNREIDKLTFKGIFKSAGKHGLLSIDEVDRWCNYRDSRNETAHDYGFDLAVKILPLLPQFIIDAERLVILIGERNVVEG